jgi:acetyl-CoA carboxylase carboxyl transferase subunit beta
LHARDLLRLGVVDGIIPEPENGTGPDPARAAEILRAALSRELAALSGLRQQDIVAARRERFRRFGNAEEIPFAAELGEVR